MKKNIQETEKKTKGRPRNFDIEKVLDTAMRIFWSDGYETASISKISAETGLTPPSLYAAFGNKEELFFKCLEHYGKTLAIDIEQVINDHKTAKEGIENCLIKIAESYTQGGQHGCMVISCAVNCSEESKSVQEKLREKRKASELAIKKRIERAIEETELPPSANAGQLAKFFASVIQGMSTQSQDGASEESLIAVARNAMKVWPDKCP